MATPDAAIIATPPSRAALEAMFEPTSNREAEVAGGLAENDQAIVPPNDKVRDEGKIAPTTE